MRNIAMIPGILALLLTGVLFYVVYHKPQPERCCFGLKLQR